MYELYINVYIFWHIRPHTLRECDIPSNLLDPASRFLCYVDFVVGQKDISNLNSTNCGNETTFGKQAPRFVATLFVFEFFYLWNITSFLMAESREIELLTSMVGIMDNFQIDANFIFQSCESARLLNSGLPRINIDRSIEVGVITNKTDILEDIPENEVLLATETASLVL